MRGVTIRGQVMLEHLGDTEHEVVVTETLNVDTRE